MGADNFNDNADEQFTQSLNLLVQDEGAGNEAGSDAEAYAALKARRAERRRKKLIRRGIVAGVAAVVVILAVVVTTVFMGQDETETEPVTDTVTRGNFVTSVSGKGTLKPVSATTISPSVDGTVSELRVSSGQSVAAGDVLMVLKNDELTQAVTDAQRTLTDAKTDLATAQQALATAQKGTTTTDEEGNQTWQAGDTANAQEQVNIAKRSVDTAQASLDAAQAKVNALTVTAPSAGSIIDLNVQTGSVISGGVVSGGTDSKTVMQIADMSQMRVTVSIGEEDIMSIAQGQSVNVTFSAISDLTCAGTVENIASVANSSGSTDGSSSAAFDVDVIIPSPDSRLKPGMTAKAEIVTKEIDDVIMVPSTALVDNGDGSYSVRLETNADTHEYKMVTVEVAEKNDNFAVVGRPGDSTGSDVNGGDTASDDPAPNASLPVSELKEGDTIISMLAEELASDSSDAE